jgi:hypothetical protein
MVQRGVLTWLGDFDKDGNFIRHPHLEANLGAHGGSGLPSFVYALFGGNLPVYEHRSGRLLRGTSVDKPYSVFVPEIGSTVTDIKEFDLKKPDRMVWNLIETGPAFWTKERQKEFPRGLPKGTEPPKAGTPAGWEFIPYSKLDTDFAGRKLKEVKPIKHARAIGDVVEFGTLSDEGEFVPDPDLPVVARAGILGPIKFDLFSVPRYFTIPQDTGRKGGSEGVYEYRSGRLIRGTLHQSGNFVPELGSKVLDFKDYNPEQVQRLRIYNLPGELRKKEK